MKFLKITFLSTLLSVSLVLTGCAKNTVNNANTNILEQNENVDQVVLNNNQNINQVAVANGNTNTANENINSEDINTSDWQTYTNEEYGFSFRYPKEWGEVVVKKSEADQYQTGSKIMIIFSNDNSRNANGFVTATVTIESLDYQFTGPADGENIPFSKVDLTQSDNQLNSALKQDNMLEISVKKITLNNKNGLYIKTKNLQLDNSIYSFDEYLFPKFSINDEWNMRIYGDQKIRLELQQIINSINIF